MGVIWKQKPLYNTGISDSLSTWYKLWKNILLLLFRSSAIKFQYEKPCSILLILLLELQQENGQIVYWFFESAFFLSQACGFTFYRNIRFGMAICLNPFRLWVLLLHFWAGSVYLLRFLFYHENTQEVSTSSWTISDIMDPSFELKACIDLPCQSQISYVVKSFLKSISDSISRLLLIIICWIYFTLALLLKQFTHPMSRSYALLLISILP